MSTSGMHRRPFEGRHLVLLCILLFIDDNLLILFIDYNLLILIVATYFDKSISNLFHMSYNYEW